MNTIYTVLIIGGSLILTACENTMVIGHKHSVNVAVEAKADASEPVNINFGYESHSVVIVPPREPLTLGERSVVKDVPQGDLLSTLSYFKIERTQSNSTTPGTQFTIRTGVATGAAANKLASPAPIPATVSAQSVNTAGGIGEKMNVILFGH